MLALEPNKHKWHRPTADKALFANQQLLLTQKYIRPASLRVGASELLPGGRREATRQLSRLNRRTVWAYHSNQARRVLLPHAHIEGDQLPLIGPEMAIHVRFPISLPLSTFSLSIARAPAFSRLVLPTTPRRQEGNLRRRWSNGAGYVSCGATVTRRTSGHASGFCTTGTRTGPCGRPYPLAVSGL
jgi:hypothetical protein